MTRGRDTTPGKTKMRKVTLRPVSYWLVWGVDDREPFTVPGKRGVYLYVGGVPTKVDPERRRPFSYVTWTNPHRGVSSPWTYRRDEAEQFHAKSAAFAMRTLLFELGWGRRPNKSLRECYGITRVTRWLPPRSAS